MMTHPDLKKIWNGRRGMKAGIEACVKAKCVVSAMTLIYSAIDAMAALTRPLKSPRATRDEFKKWVDDYLSDQLKDFDIHVSSLDIYGARCGILHTYGPESDLSRDGKAKTIVYKWREGHRPDDPLLAKYEKTAIIVEIESLAEALNKAVALFQDRIEGDPELKQRVEKHVKNLLCYQPWCPVQIVVSEP